MDNKHCQICGAGLDGDARYCIDCGAPVMETPAMPIAPEMPVAPVMPVIQAEEPAKAVPGYGEPAQPGSVAGSGPAMGVGEAPAAPSFAQGVPVQAGQGYAYPPNAYGAQPPVYGGGYVAQPPMPQAMLQNETVSVWSYIWPNLLLFVPFLGWVAWLIVMIVIAAGTSHKESFRNYAKASLIMVLAPLALVVLLFVVVAIGV